MTQSELQESGEKFTELYDQVFMALGPKMQDLCKELNPANDPTENFYYLQALSMVLGNEIACANVTLWQQCSALNTDTPPDSEDLDFAISTLHNSTKRIYENFVGIMVQMHGRDREEIIELLSKEQPVLPDCLVGGEK